jgi:hypothetical protein
MPPTEGLDVTTVGARPSRRGRTVASGNGTSRSRTLMLFIGRGEIAVETQGQRDRAERRGHPDERRPLGVGRRSVAANVVLTPGVLPYWCGCLGGVRSSGWT